ncbi:RHS repeat-associated core domain-containing protein [Sorangium sp. So ce1036]|uniref:RHS repeat-associated core domain-containing protein n=1 Tax=Sorangium sp. So ce1036 TaxID=3133328 RepID=UPI003F0352F9
MSVGHPIDVASGAMFNTWMDCAFPGSVPLVFSRFYSTALLGARSPGPLGPGWRHCFQHELRQTLEGFVYVDHEGAEHVLDDPGESLLKQGRLIAARAGIELRGTRDRIALRFYTAATRPHALHFTRIDGTARYRLDAIVGLPQVRLDLTYDASGRLHRARQSRSDRAIELRYDAQGRIAAVSLVDPREDIVRFDYDSAGRLVRVSDGIAPNAPITVFEYDAEDRIVAEAKRTGAIHVFRYDGHGRCVYTSGSERFEERTLRYSAAKRETEVTDSHGHVTRYHYNEAGQVLRVQYPDGAERTSSFDDDGRTVMESRGGVVMNRLQYDELGRVLVASFPEGIALRFTYDDQHRMRSLADARGQTWHYTYDERGLLTETRDPFGHGLRYEYNAHGEVVRAADPLGGATSLEWDDRGQLRAVIDPDGQRWSLEHDRYGLRSALRDPEGGVWRITHDRARRISVVEHPDGRRLQTEHDLSGRPTVERLSDGTTRHLRHNSCGQIVEIREADGTIVRFEWDTEPRRLLAIQDGLGNRIEYTYDPVGRPLTRRNWDGAIHRFEYDAAGNVAAITDPGGERVTFDYNGLGALLRKKESDGDVTAYRWNEDGFLVGIEARESELRFERDFYGRITAEVQNGVAVRSEYDIAGRRVRLRSDHGAQIAWDWSPGSRCQALQHGSDVLRFLRDGLGRELSCFLPGGGEFRQAYDPVGRVTWQSYQAPRHHGAAEAARAPLERRISYDPAGHVACIEDSLRGRTDFLHDPLGRLRAVLSHVGRSAFFELDASGNRVSSASVDPARVLLPSDPRTLDRQSLRSLGADITELRIAAGNRIAETCSAEQVTRYSHDAAGRLIRKEVYRAGAERPEIWQYEWHRSGTLSAVVRPDGARWTYAYDALHRRIEKRGPQGTIRYIWDGDHLLHRVGPDDTAETRVRHPDLPSPVVIARGGTSYSLLHDAVGSVSEVVDAAGKLIWWSRKGAWGELSPDIAGEASDGFPGQMYDAESGLYYNHHRYYDPEVGRYISPDPIGLLGGLNEYSYVPSPVAWSDPAGLVWTGGPYFYAGLLDSHAYPDIWDDRTIFFRRSAGKTAPSEMQSPSVPDHKTLAVLRVLPSSGTPDLPWGPGAYGFVSGVYDGENKKGAPMPKMPPPPPGWNASVGTNVGHNGIHAEIHALNSLLNEHLKSGQKLQGRYQLFIDKPPCSRNAHNCATSLPLALEDLHSRGIHVDVYYLDDSGKWKKMTCH